MATNDSGSAHRDSSAISKEDRTGLPSLLEATEEKETSALGDDPVDFNLWLEGEYGEQEPNSIIESDSMSIDELPSLSHPPENGQHLVNEGRESCESFSADLSPNVGVRLSRSPVRIPAGDANIPDTAMPDSGDIEFMADRAAMIIDEFDIEMRLETPIIEEIRKTSTAVPYDQYVPGQPDWELGKPATGDKASEFDKALDALDALDVSDQSPCPRGKRQPGATFTLENAGALGAFDAFNQTPHPSGELQLQAGENSADTEGAFNAPDPALDADTDMQLDGAVNSPNTLGGFNVFDPTPYASTNLQPTTPSLREKYQEFAAAVDARQIAVDFSRFTLPQNLQKPLVDAQPLAFNNQNDTQFQGGITDPVVAPTLTSNAQPSLNNNFDFDVPTLIDHIRDRLNEKFYPDIPMPSIEDDDDDDDDDGGDDDESHSPPAFAHASRRRSSSAQEGSSSPSHGRIRNKSIGIHTLLSQTKPAFKVSSSKTNDGGQEAKNSMLAAACEQYLKENYPSPSPDPSFLKYKSAGGTRSSWEADWSTDGIYQPSENNEGPPVPPYDPLGENLTSEEQQQEAERCLQTAEVIFQDDFLANPNWHNENILAGHLNSTIRRVDLAFLMEEDHVNEEDNTMFEDPIEAPESSTYRHLPGEPNTDLSISRHESLVVNPSGSPKVAESCRTTDGNRQAVELNFGDKPQPIPTFESDRSNDTSQSGSSPSKKCRSRSRSQRKNSKRTKEVFNSVINRQAQMGRRYLNSESPSSRQIFRRGSPSKQSMQNYATDIPDSPGPFITPSSRVVGNPWRNNRQNIPNDSSSATLPAGEGGQYRAQGYQGYSQNIPSNQGFFAPQNGQGTHGYTTQSYQVHPANVSSNTQAVVAPPVQGAAYPPQVYQGHAPNPPGIMNLPTGQVGYPTQGYQGFASNPGNMGHVGGQGAGYAGYQNQGYQTTNHPSNMTSASGQDPIQPQGYQGTASNFLSNVASVASRGPEYQPSYAPSQVVVFQRHPSNLSNNMNTGAGQVPLSNITSILGVTPEHLMQLFLEHVAKTSGNMSSTAGQGTDLTQSHQGNHSSHPNDMNVLTAQDIHRTQARYEGYPPNHPRSLSFSSSSAGQGNGMASSSVSAPQNQQGFNHHSRPLESRSFPSGGTQEMMGRSADNKGFGTFGNSGEQMDPRQSHHGGNNQQPHAVDNNTAQHGQMFADNSLPTKPGRITDNINTGIVISRPAVYYNLPGGNRMAPRGDEDGSPVADKLRRQIAAGKHPSRRHLVGTQEPPVFTPRPLVPRPAAQSPEDIDSSPIPLKFPALTPRLSTREKAVIGFRGHKECAKGLQAIQDAIKSNPGKGVMITETFEDKPMSIIVSAPAGSMIRGWVKELLPHARVDVSIN